MGDDERGLFAGQIVVQSLEGARGQRGEGLVLAHQVEIGVGHEVESGESLVEQAAVLRRHTDAAIESRRAPQGQDQRGQLDGFRPGAENYRGFMHLPRGHSQTDSVRHGKFYPRFFRNVRGSIFLPADYNNRD